MSAKKRILLGCILGIGAMLGSAYWACGVSRPVSANTKKIVDDEAAVLDLIARRNQVKAQLIPRYQ